MTGTGEKIRTVVVDDEELSCRGLSILVSADPGFEVVATCLDGEDAIETILAKKPDLVILDIQMPELSGFDVIEAIKADYLPVIIFVTAYDQYALKAFQVHALDYILKPYSQKQLDEALRNARDLILGRKNHGYQEKILRLLSAQKYSGEPAQDNRFLKRIMVRTNGKIKFLKLEEVLWFEGADYYVRIHTRDSEYLHRESLRKVEGKLNQNDFLRIHNSIIVNLSHVENICENNQAELVAVLHDGRQLKVSKRRKKALLDLSPSRFGFKS